VRVRIYKAAVALVLFVLIGACDPPPISLTDATFSTGTVEGVDLTQPTALEIGPDGRLYIAELEGRIVAITLDESGHNATLIEEIAAADAFNQVLGMAFDPTASTPTLYVANNFVNGTASSPFSNQIIRLSGQDFSDSEVVISGLPVSGHNHGTNDLEFDQDGRLLIAQGGTTSVGAAGDGADPRWRDWDETPLSGAILLASVNDPGFRGDIAYDSPGATSATSLIAGDVRVFSPGHRNTYDFVIHSNGNIYSLDNGSSEPLPASLDCETLGPPPENDPDQLNLVVENGYYGHPNRNRARTDPRQCSYVSPNDEGIDDNMLLLVPPSSNALIEYRGDHFAGGWKGDLLYAWWTGGEIRRIKLAQDGRSVEDQEIVATGLSLPLAMVQANNAGIIYVIEFGSGKLIYLEPQE
jgi:glucose/arabinose dehydrogenase